MESLCEDRVHPYSLLDKPAEVYIPFLLSTSYWKTEKTISLMMLKPVASSFHQGNIYFITFHMEKLGPVNKAVTYKLFK